MQVTKLEYISMHNSAVATTATFIHPIRCRSKLDEGTLERLTIEAVRYQPLELLLR